MDIIAFDVARLRSSHTGSGHSPTNGHINKLTLYASSAQLLYTHPIHQRPYNWGGSERWMFIQRDGKDMRSMQTEGPSIEIEVHPK